MSEYGERCCEEVSRDGELQPCDFPTVAVRVDPSGQSLYEVCAHHARGEMVPLADVNAERDMLRGELAAVRVENERHLRNWEQECANVERLQAEVDRWSDRARQLNRELGAAEAALARVAELCDEADRHLNAMQWASGTRFVAWVSTTAVRAAVRGDSNG